MRPMTAEQRGELGGVKNARLVRLAIYDLGIVIGAILLADKTPTLVGLWPLRLGEYSPEESSAIFAVMVWVALNIARYLEWKKIERIDKLLDRDEMERETGDY